MRRHNPDTCNSPGHAQTTHPLPSTRTHAILQRRSNGGHVIATDDVTDDAIADVRETVSGGVTGEVVRAVTVEGVVEEEEVGREVEG